MFGDFQSLKPNPDEHRIQPIGASQLGVVYRRSRRTQKDAPPNEKVPSQGLRGTFKNCQRLILAESVSPSNARFTAPAATPPHPTGHRTGQKKAGLPVHIMADLQGRIWRLKV